MKNKIGLLSLLVLFVFSLGNAQNTQVVKVKDTLSDYEVEDEFDEDFKELAYPFEQFKKLVNGIHYQNYKMQMCISVEGQYITTFMQGLDESFMIVAISNQGFQDEIKLAKYECIMQQTQSLYYAKIWNEQLNKYDDQILLKEQPKYDLVISVMSTSGLSKESLMIIANQLGF
jgi:hypothetical protein